MSGFPQWRVGLMIVEIVSRIVPVALDIVEERTGMPSEMTTALIVAKLEETGAAWTSVRPETIGLFVQAIASLISDLESK